MTTCIGNDPLCPCQDGLACHYKDYGKSKGWPIPASEPELKNLLQMLLANCDSLKAEGRHGPVVWDERKPTIFYLQRNMEWAREALKA